MVPPPYQPLPRYSRAKPARADILHLHTLILKAPNVFGHQQSSRLHHPPTAVRPQMRKHRQPLQLHWSFKTHKVSSPPSIPAVDFD